MKGKLLELFLNSAPDFMIFYTIPLLNRVIPPDTKYETKALSRFASCCLKHYDQVVEKVKNNHKVMIIEQGRFEYPFFNICFLNNVIGLIIYSLYKGCLPIIKIQSTDMHQSIWDWYFLQPFEIEKNDEIVVCDRKSTSFRPNIRTGFGADAYEVELWSFFYKKFVKLNVETQKYVNKELECIHLGDNSLGLLIRGTDYTGLKPSGHPIQPSIDELISKAIEFNSLYCYHGIYVATEEKRLYDAICDAFGEKNVRQNKREYYDEQYYNQQLSYIGEVKFERDNDAFFRGLEYLSSLIILSQCTDLIAGNCGGTEFAVLYSNGYRNKFVFDKGLY